MKPSLGRIVLVHVDPSQNNGTDVAPAIITRVWSDDLVNVRVLCDGHAVDWRTSLRLYDEEPEGSAVFAAAWWPPRVG